MKIKKFMATIFATMFVACTGFFAAGFSTPVKVAMAETNVAVEEENKANDVHTVGTRIKEWFSEYFLEFIGSADLGAAILLVVSAIIKEQKDKKRSKSSDFFISENTSAALANTESSERVLEAVNKLIELQNEHDGKELSRDKMSEQNLVLQKAILEILVAVYVNNKNLPQATKDIVNHKYVSALKTESALKNNEVVQ